MLSFPSSSFDVSRNLPVQIRQPEIYSRREKTQMKPITAMLVLLAFAVMTASGPVATAQQSGPYKVLKTARVGGEGSWDYIYADSAGRRLYIPRRTTPLTPDVQTRLT